MPEHDAETTEQEVVTATPDTENGEHETDTDAGASAGRVPALGLGRVGRAGRWARRCDAGPGVRGS